MTRKTYEHGGRIWCIDLSLVKYMYVRPKTKKSYDSEGAEIKTLVEGHMTAVIKTTVDPGNPIFISLPKDQMLEMISDWENTRGAE